MVCDLWYSVGFLHHCGHSNHHAVPGTLDTAICLKAHGPLWTAATLESVSFYNDWTVFEEESRRNSVALGDERRIKLFLASSLLCSPTVSPLCFDSSLVETRQTRLRSSSAAMSLSPEEMFYLATGLLDLNSWTGSAKTKADNNEHSRTKCAGMHPHPALIMFCQGAQRTPTLLVGRQI